MDDVELKYDANGNLIEKGDRRFYYDFRNRLTRVTESVSGSEVEIEIASYVYDGFNRRISKTAAGEPLEGTVWSGWRELELHRGGTLFSRHTFGLGLDEIVKMEIDSDLSGTTDTDLYPIYDSTGNLIGLTNEQAGVVAQYRYSPFGIGLDSYVDLDPPTIPQVGIEGDTIWIEFSEELRLRNLEEGISTEDIELSMPIPPLSASPAGTADSKAVLRKTLVPITVHQPIQDGRHARRRVIITATDPPPEPGTEVQLTLSPPA
ncbi:MAG: hypothetical protein GY856_33430, partial [bacterium]|nr:hypothetical protein [bacterium]